MKKSKLIAGVLTAIMLTGSVQAMATAAEATAKISPQKIYVDGQRVELLAYNINDNNYVRIRDAGKAVDFSVTYEESTDSVWIDRSHGYDGEISDLPIPGNNPTAKPSEQTIYARGMLAEITMYNIAGNNFAKLRDLGAALNFAIAYDPAADAVYIDRKTAYLPNMTPELLQPEAIPKKDAESIISNESRGEENPYFILTGEKLIRTAEIEMITTYLSEEYNAVIPFIDELNAMSTNREKINAIVRYVCERMTYSEPDEGTYTRIGQDSGENITRSMRYAMFLDNPPVKGVCFHYAKAVNFLCTLSGVPTEFIESYNTNHAWNAVYADGEWWYVDATNEDIADEPISSDKNVLFAMDTPNLPFSDDNPESTKQRMEQLIPGSTK